MSEADVKRLFQEIALVYPSFEKNLGNLRMVQVWHKHLLGMSDTAASRILDKHLASEDGNKAPTLNTFVRELSTKVEAYTDDRPGHYRLVNGVLYWCVDDEMYETGNTGEEPYYCNELGYICRNHMGQEIVLQR